MLATRAELRDRIEPGYSFVRHALAVHAVALTALVGPLAFLHDVEPAQLATVPLTFLLANAIEYAAHRGPMHHATPGLSALFARHTLAHHAFFRADAMGIEGPREMRYVLFPAWAGALVLLLAAPLGVALGWLVARNVGLLYGATAASYYLLYEWMHSSYHLAPELVARVPLLRRAAARHTLHHDPARMTSVNFNIAFPIVDALLGTGATS